MLTPRLRAESRKPAAEGYYSRSVIQLQQVPMIQAIFSSLDEN